MTTDFTQSIRDNAKMYSVSERESQFHAESFVMLPPDYVAIAKQISAFITTFPCIQAGNDFNKLVDAIVIAHQEGKPVIIFIGGHVIKLGLAPIFIEMMKRDVISHVAMNGAAAIHDIEIAMMGHTSEWVKDLLPDGKWGMWKETGEVIHDAIAKAYQVDEGLGYGLANEIVHYWHNYSSYSILANHMPTVHVSIGCDVIHQHPQVNFKHIGATSGRDFHKLVEAVKGLNDGGVFINFGSSAMGPEVFSKALNLARNTGNEVKNFTTANFDIIELPDRLSRAKKNVISRPHIGSEGKGYNFVGSHEIMIPLLWYSVLGRLQ